MATNEYLDYAGLSRLKEKMDAAYGGGGGGGSQIVANYTLSASKWSGQYYSFESDYPVASYNLTIGPSENTTTAQLNAFQRAKIVGSATQNRIKSLGSKPTVDIPIMIVATPK